MRREELYLADLVDSTRAIRDYLSGVSRREWDESAVLTREDLEFYRSCPGERSWWRLAETTDGELAGFAIPSATPYHRNVGYLGVVPEQRGHGYVDDLLGEITRFHVAAGADCITATTDRANTPMAAAFDRAGYRVTEAVLVFQAPAA
jgi:RimJ/RimL family protein N-acetyltransferase